MSTAASTPVHARDIEPLAERVVANQQSRNSRWLAWGNTKRMGWHIAGCSKAKASWDIYLMPDCRVAIVAPGKTQGTERSPHQAIAILTIAALCASHDETYKLALRVLAAELNRQQPRPPSIFGFSRRS